jgi:outer membrane lipoprotein-sorting protein
MSIFTSRPALRWGVPVVVFGAVIGGGAAARTLAASADPSLPSRTAAQLLVDLQTARLDGGSGTVVEQADLGLPSLPGLGGQGSSDITSLASGSHTMRVWFSGPDKARVALLGTLGEQDIITNGHDVWHWDSQKNSATHSVISQDEKAQGSSQDQKAQGTAPKHPGINPNELPKTPQDAASAALAAIDASTKVTTSGAARVAGRSAYELVLQPRDTASLVGRITLAIDSQQHVPLRVQVFPAGSDKAAFQVEFTQVSFKRPDDSQFKFSPPPNTKVTEEQPDSDTGTKPDTGAQAPTERPTIIGQGWTSIISAKLPPDALNSTPKADQGRQSLSLNALPKVSGSWGSGHLLTSKLFSVLITDDGRVLAGAVKPDRLYQAAAR